MTWPVIKALKRKYPDCEIHGLFRERFVSAAEVSDDFTVIHKLPSQEIFSHFLKSQDYQLSATALEKWSEPIRDQNYDIILNFSFSPVSSFLVNYLAAVKTEIYGYCRHQDGYLNLADDVSRYFYAQVGPGKYNRIHLTDLMAQMAQVDLIPQDFQVEKSLVSKTSAIQVLAKYYLNQDPYVVLHLGASEIHKRLSALSWLTVINQIKEQFPEYKIILVGGKDDLAITQQIHSALQTDKIINAVGQTPWSDLFHILRNSKCFMGADSGPMHLAVLAKCHIVNFSLGYVNFWETGPRSSRAVIFREMSEENFNFKKMFTQIRLWMDGKSHGISIQGIDQIPSFLLNYPDHDFEWRLLQAIYLGTAFPVCDQMKWVKALQNLIELNDIAIQSLLDSESQARDFLGPYLDRIYETMNLLVQQEPSMGIFVNWLRAEKCKVAAADFHKISEQYLEIHQMFEFILKPYKMENVLTERI